jgi:hypothetical protein
MIIFWMKIAEKILNLRILEYITENHQGSFSKIKNKLQIKMFLGKNHPRSLLIQLIENLTSFLERNLWELRIKNHRTGFLIPIIWTQ